MTCAAAKNQPSPDCTSCALALWSPSWPAIGTCSAPPQDVPGRHKPAWQIAGGVNQIKRANPHTSCWTWEPVR
jgi:hypothetical protein